MEKKTMFEILDEYKDIRAQLEESGGELTPELEEALAINRNDASDKVEALYYVIQKYKSEEDFVKLQQDRLETKKKVYTKIQTKLQDKINEAVELYGEINIKSKAKGWKSRVLETTTLKATAISYPVLKTSSLDLVHDPELQIPEKYIKYKIVPSEISKLDKEKLLNAAKDLGLNIQFSTDIDVGTLKSDLIEQQEINIKSGIEEKEEEIIGKFELNPNFKVKFS